MNIKAEAVNGKLVVTDTDANKVLDGIEQIEITTDADGKACIGLWSTQFVVQSSIGPQKNADGSPAK